MLALALTTTALLAGAVHTSDRFWTDHGYTITTPAVIQETDIHTTRPGIAAEAEVNGNHIWVDNGYLNDIRARIRIDRPSAIDALEELCEVVDHERGHNLGLQHAATGIMHAPPDTTIAPAECVGWATSLLPKPVTRSGGSGHRKVTWLVSQRGANVINRAVRTPRHTPRRLRDKPH